MIFIDGKVNYFWFKSLSVWWTIILYHCYHIIILGWTLEEESVKQILMIWHQLILQWIALLPTSPVLTEHVYLFTWGVMAFQTVPHKKMKLNVKRFNVQDITGKYMEWFFKVALSVKWLTKISVFLVFENTANEFEVNSLLLQDLAYVIVHIFRGIATDTGF